MIFNKQTIFNKLVFLDHDIEKLAHVIMQDCIDTGMNKTSIALFLGGNPYFLYDHILLECGTELKIVRVENVSNKSWRYDCIIQGNNFEKQVNRRMVMKGRTTRLLHVNRCIY